MVKFLRSRGKLYEVFEPSFDCKYCYGDNFIEQKLNYIHNNPVKSKWQLAESAVEYLHSSAYFTFTPKGSKQFMKLHRINGLENEWIKLYTQSAFQDTLLRRIYDYTGKAVKKLGKYSVSNDKFNKELNLSDLANGVYFIFLSLDNKYALNFKIIKNK